ncbi:MAG TPA: MFS transporter [Terriglobales bacterium]|nr:MFS transporter [Terriglobales bacterium]
MSFASLFSDMSHEAATAILPLYLTALGAGAAALGVIEGAADAASSLLKFLSGHYSDRIGRRKEIAIAGYSLTAIAKPAFAFATSWTSILALRALAWMGRGSRGPVRDAMLADSVTPATYGRGFGLQRSMDTVGAVLGPALALLLVSHVQLRTIFLLTFMPGAAAVAAIALVRDRRRDGSRLRMAHAWSEFPRAFKTFLLAAGLFGVGNFAHTLLILRASEVLRPAFAGKADAMAIGLYTLHNAVYAATSFPAGHLGDFVSRRWLLLTAYLLFAGVALGFGVAGSLVPLVALFVGAGLYIGMVDALEASYAAQLLPEAVRGSGFGLLGLVNGIGDLISSAAVGFLWWKYSALTAFTCAAIFALTGAVLLIPAGRRKDTPNA